MLVPIINCSIFNPRLLLLLAVLLISGIIKGFGQTIGRHAIFKKLSLTELRQQNFAPQHSPFQPVTFTPVYRNPILGENSVEQQNKLILQQHGMLPGQNPKQREYELIKQELREDELKEKEAWRFAMRKPFQNSFQEFLKLNPDSFSITRAIYLCESAWYDNPPTWQEFEMAIQAQAGLVKEILKREGLSSKNNIAVNYAIQKLYRQDNQFVNPKTKQIFTVPRLRYDFNDFMGEKNWSNMFVTKLLATGKGQCHSLPLLYLAIAEQLSAKAYLSLSPGHSFIQFFDNNGYRYNFETTNGNLVTHTWLMQSSFVNATALKNRTYLDTLSRKQLYAHLLSDLLQNYLNKLGYDEIAWQITSKILVVHPMNVAALMTQANFYTFIAKQKFKEAGYPSLEKLPSYPEANRAYQDMLKSYELIEQTGFQDMPQEDYQRWLKTVEEEKKKQKNLEMLQKMKQEAKKGKQLK